MKGCLLIVGSAVGGLAVGLPVIVILRAVTGNGNLAVSIGTGVWLLTCSTLLAYGALLLTDLTDPEKPKTASQRRRFEKAQGQLQTAELRMAFVFGLIGGVTANLAQASDVTIAIVAVCCAVAGGIIGYDVKRRVRRIRESSPANTTCRDG